MDVALLMDVALSKLGGPDVAKARAYLSHIQDRIDVYTAKADEGTQPRLALRIDEGEAHVAIVSTSLGTAMTRDDEKPWWMRVLRRTVPLEVRVQVDVKQYVLRVSPELEVPPGRMKAPYITSRIIGVDVDSNLDISLALRDVRHPFAIKAVDYGIDRLAHLDIETTKPGHDQHLHLRCDAPESSATSANLLVSVLVA